MIDSTHESKGELTDRLRREGRFDEFKNRREELKASGVPAKQAWEEAATEFRPTEASSEIRPTTPWSRAKEYVQAAETDFDWLWRAMYVRIPREVARAKPRQYATLMAIRANQRLLQRFYVKAISILAAEHRAKMKLGHFDEGCDENRKSLTEILEDARLSRNGNGRRD